nr:hypothetical protein [Tanacetum cinerariifolium]
MERNLNHEQVTYTSSLSCSSREGRVVFTIARAICMHDYDMLSPSHGGSIGLDREFGFTSLEMTASKTSSSSNPINIVFKKRTFYEVAIHDGHELYEIGLKDDGLRHFKDASFTEFGESYPQMVGSHHASFTPPAAVCRRTVEKRTPTYDT